MSTQAVDIGQGVSIEFFVNSDGLEQGIIETHPHRQTGDPCFGAVFWDRTGSVNAGPTWTLESRDPLTLSPSILCRICGNHGFIREGKWVPA